MRLGMLTCNSFITEHFGNQKQIPLLSDKHCQLKQFEAAEAAILEYYDQECTRGIYCTGCPRNSYVERAIADKHGITNFRKFDELFSRNYF